jgi:hypothetical protein
MEFLDQLQGTLSQLGVDRHIDKFKNQIYNYTENELKVCFLLSFRRESQECY